MVGFARLSPPYELPHGLGDYETGLDIRAEWLDRRPEFGREARLGLPNGSGAA